MRFLVFVCAFMIVHSESVLADLIEPSRDLTGNQEPSGRLSVFSEPPELDVFLDGAEIGKTPLISQEVTAGVHTLRIEDTEEEITISSEKPTRMSFFKGALIEIPEQEPESPAPPKSEQRAPAEEEKQESPAKDQKQYDPFYWPMNPSGPIK